MTKSPCLFAFFFSWELVLLELSEFFVAHLSHYFRTRAPAANMLIVGIRIKSWKGRESNFPPFPWIQQLLLSNIHRGSIAVYHLVMERVRLSGTLEKIDLNLILKMSQLLVLVDPSHLILAERGRLIDASPEAPLIYNRGQTNTNTPKILCWI